MEASGIDKKKAVLLVIGAVCFLILFYIGMSVYFMSHFYFGSRVNGANASAKDIDTVKDLILDVADNYKLTLIEADGKTESISSSDVDLKIDVNSGKIEEFLTSQSGWGWPGALFSSNEYSSAEIVSFDEDKLKTIVKKLDCVTDKNVKKTKNAKPEYDTKEKVFVIKDEVYGQNIKKKPFREKLSQALLSLDDAIDLEKDKCYVQPKVTKDSKELNNLIDKMNEILERPVVYTLEGVDDEVVDKDEIAKWLTSADSKELSFDDDALLAFVTKMSEKYNTFGYDKELKTTSGITVRVPGNSYGWKIDKDGEIAKIKEEIDAGEEIRRDFEYLFTANSHDKKHDYGDKYVEVDLTDQMVYCYDNGELVCQTSCVSGNTAKGNGTPVGAYQITYKEKDATLNGENYSSPVTYWMPFNGNIGLHDASWRSSFGGGIYRTSGSHGCVNLPKYAAATIFEHVEKAEAVLVYTRDYAVVSTKDTDTKEKEQ